MVLSKFHVETKNITKYGLEAQLEQVDDDDNDKGHVHER
jgi:hypothetical protein